MNHSNSRPGAPQTISTDEQPDRQAVTAAADGDLRAVVAEVKVSQTLRPTRLQGDQGNLIVRATANLTCQLRANLQDLPGTRVLVTYTGDTPSKKGFPVKLFDVETVEVVAPANEPMQQPVGPEVAPAPVKTEQAA